MLMAEYDYETDITVQREQASNSLLDYGNISEIIVNYLI